MIRRNGKCLVLLSTRFGIGVTLHRHGGVSLVGLPRRGGTSLLWGQVNHRVAREHVNAAAVGLYIGEDF